MKYDPKNATTYYNLGVALLKWAHQTGAKAALNYAIEQFQQAIEINPNFSTAYLDWGVALAEEHKYEEAVSKFQKAIAVAPDNALAYDDLGKALLYGENDPIRAEQAYRTAIKLAPKSAVSYADLGKALFMEAEIDSALATFQEGEKIADLSASKGGPEFYDAWGDALLLGKQDIDGSIDKYKKALQLKPNYTQAYLDCAVALTLKWRLDGDLRILESCLPNFLDR